MEKIFFQPLTREFHFPSPEPNAYGDIFSYTPSDKREQSLGHLYLVGQVKYGKENMAYVLNLIASLAKREFYSQAERGFLDPRQALDFTLKKLNGVLDDFFKNKELRLDLGLMVVGGDNIFLAKLGKFKILLARAGEVIDILNNIVLFQKEHRGEKKFINIISGKILPGDKIFALYPSRSAISKEKTLRQLLLTQTQDDFSVSLASLGENSRNFFLHGLHLEIKKVKAEEITIRSAYQKKQVILAASAEALWATPASPSSAKVEKEKKAVKAPEIADQVLEVPAMSDQPSEQPTKVEEEKEKNQKTESASQNGSIKILSSQMAVIERKNWLKKASEKFFGYFNRWPSDLVRLSRFFAWGIAIVAIFGLKMLFFDDPQGQRTVLKEAQEQVRLAEVEMTRQNLSAARELLSASLFSLSNFKEPGEKIVTLRERVNALLDRLDLVVNQSPKLWANLEELAAATAGSPFPLSPVQLAVQPDRTVWVINTEGYWQRISPERQILGQGKWGDQGWSELFANAQYLGLYNGQEKTGALDPNGQPTPVFSLAESLNALDTAFYENNLYLLTDNAIFKYADAFSGAGAGVLTKTRQNWTSGLANEMPRALAVDGNIHVLTGQGSIIRFFKGQEEQRINLNFQFSSTVEFFVPKDHPWFLVLDQSNKKLRAFDRESGLLIATYKLGSLSGIKDASLIILPSESPDSANPPPPALTLFLLATDGKVWTIDL